MTSLKDEDHLEGEPAPEVLEGRIWVDGCFDFFHHGHAGAIVQARQLGTELYAGVHSDEAILANKGPTVMTLDERCVADHPPIDTPSSNSRAASPRPMPAAGSRAPSATRPTLPRCPT
jgi:cytidyltransferase-like protein